MNIKLIISILLFFKFCFCYSQFYEGQIINNNNDTLKVKIQIQGNPTFHNSKIASLVNKVSIILNDSVKDYYPKDLKSFTINLDDKIHIFDNINNTEFAERLYVNKIKVYYKLLSNGGLYRIYMIIKPTGEIMNLLPNGFSRMITQKEMLKHFTDCQISYIKIQNDEFKIKNEEDLILFAIDYEKNCF
jgi:hypothetical protein